MQVPPKLPWAYQARLFFVSLWRQGVRSNYRLAYWRFLGILVWRWSRQPAKVWLGFMVLLSGHHFLNYARQVTGELEQECGALAEDVVGVEVVRVRAAGS
jgi:hypothetical protein